MTQNETEFGGLRMPAWDQSWRGAQFTNLWLEWVINKKIKNKMLSVLQSLNTDTVFHGVGIKSIFDEDTVSSDARLPVCLGEQFLLQSGHFLTRKTLLGLTTFPG